MYLHRKFTNVDPEKGPFQKEIYKSSEPITLIFRGYVSFLGGSKYIFDSQIKVARKEGDSKDRPEPQNGKDQHNDVPSIWRDKTENVDTHTEPENSPNSSGKHSGKLT